MADIISEVSQFYTLRNLPGFVSNVKNHYLSKTDIVYKLQSYIFKNNACILTQVNEHVIKHLLSLLTFEKNFCISVNLNHLEMHHIVVDLDFKKINLPDLEYVKKFYEETLGSIKFILSNCEEFEVTMFVKLKKPKYELTNLEIDKRAIHGVHFEINSCVLYRGDNVWFIEVLRKIMASKFGKRVDEIIDSPCNWSLPFSKKETNEMYLPVRNYGFKNNKLVYVNTVMGIDNTFVSEYSIIKLYDPSSVKYIFEIDTIKKLPGYVFGYLNNVKINKRSQVTVKHSTNTHVNGLIVIEAKSFPHGAYALSRFDPQTWSYVLGNSAVFKSLNPFSISYLCEEMLLHFKAYFLGDKKSGAIFNLYVFLILLYDRLTATTSSTTPLLADEVLEEVNDENLVKEFNVLQTKTCDLIEQVHTICKNSAVSSIRTINPLLFLKCLFVLSYNDYNKVEFFYDESTNETLYLSNKIINMLSNKSLTILELVKLMFPMFALQKDGTVFYYEKNRWSISTNRLEHLFLPTKILNKFGVVLYQGEEGEENLQPQVETANKKKKIGKKNNENSIKLYNELIGFWGRVMVLEFPSSLVSFVDGFVLINHGYIMFYHSPIFRGQPSNVNWSKLSAKITHISSPGCVYPQVCELLKTSKLKDTTKQSQKEGIIDYFKFSYSKEKYPKLSPTNLIKCNEREECPVYACLYYLLTLFKKDIERVIFMIWALRLIFLGVPIKKCFIWYGNGNNGKSTFSNVLYFLFGHNMATLSPDTVQGKITTLSPDLYNARHAKLVYSDDIDKINPNTLKQIVSGAYMYVRTLYQAGSGIHLKFFLMGSTNKNKFSDLDFATLKRILVIPFTNYFDDNSDYYCNNETFERLSGDLLATMFWIERFKTETNIFFDSKNDIINPPKSCKWYSHEAVWKNDITGTFLKAFNIREFPNSFVRIEDLINEINIVKGGNKAFKYPLNTLFEDVETILNLLRHRFSVGKALNKTKSVYEDVIVGITIDKYKILYDEALELV